MIDIDIGQIVHALSDALDLVGVNDVCHGKRVAYTALECGKHLQLDQATLLAIRQAGLLHDCGVSSTQAHARLVEEFEPGDALAHCLRGEALLGRCGLFADLARIVRHHHTRFCDLPRKLDTHVATAANLIFLADRIDVAVARLSGKNVLLCREELFASFTLRAGTFFDPRFVDAFVHVGARESFWFTLQENHLLNYFRFDDTPGARRGVDNRTLLEIASIFADVVDAKSPFTSEHSRGVARLARFIGVRSGVALDRLVRLEAAGYLHDIGKLHVPDEILDKPGSLTAEERAVIMRHSFESYQILSRIAGFEEIAQWAGRHHENLLATGYPFKLGQASLGLESRILAVADVFQALAQNRPYRNSLPAGEILVILTAMADKGQLDPALVGLCADNLEACFASATAHTSPG